MCVFTPYFSALFSYIPSSPQIYGCYGGLLSSRGPWNTKSTGRGALSRVWAKYFGCF